MMITPLSIRNNGRSHSSGAGVSAWAAPKSSFPKECLHEGQSPLLQQQGGAKSHQRLGIIRRLDFQRGVFELRILFKPNMFRLDDCMTEMVFRIPGETNSYCLRLVSARCERDAF